MAITKPNSRCPTAVGEADGADQQTTEDQPDEHQAGSGSTEQGTRAVGRRRATMKKTEEGSPRKGEPEQDEEGISGHRDSELGHRPLATS